MVRVVKVSIERRVQRIVLKVRVAPRTICDTIYG